jgi:hypothetical protein
MNKSKFKNMHTGFRLLKRIKRHLNNEIFLIIMMEINNRKICVYFINLKFKIFNNATCYVKCYVNYDT